MDDVSGMAYALAQGIDGDAEVDQEIRGRIRRAIDREDEFPGNSRAHGEGASCANALSKYLTYMSGNRERAQAYYSLPSLYD